LIERGQQAVPIRILSSDALNQRRLLTWRFIMKNIILITKLISAAVILVEDAFDGKPGVSAEKLDAALKAVRDGLTSAGAVAPSWLTDDLIKAIINTAVSLFNSLGIFSKGK
jgi:hypothetical protein